MGKLINVITNLILMVVSALALTAVILTATLLTLPDVMQLEKCFTTTMYGVYLCSTSENYTPIKEISPFLIHAVIVAEDGSFYSHEGFDWHEMQESFEQDLRAGHIRRGGSTLTQQLAKNVFLDKEKSLWRKVKEAYLAHGIERHYNKDFILEKYLNVVEFGDNLYGVKPAAKRYFHKSPRELNPLESAFLAYLLPNPKLYSKTFNKGELTPYARRTINVILKRMNAYGKLSPEAYETAMTELPKFPWSGFSSNAFQGGPSFNLDVPASREKSIDEEAAEEVLQEESGTPAQNAISEKPIEPAPHPVAEPNPSEEPKSAEAPTTEEDKAPPE